MPPAPARSGGNKGVIAGIIAGVLAIALVVITIGFVVSEDDSSGGKPSSDPLQLASGTFQFKPDRSVLWKVETPSASPSDRSNLIGQWVNAKNVVVGDESSLTGYDLKNGNRLWTAHMPGAGGLPCAMSETVTSTGLGAVLYRESASRSIDPCTLLAIVDTNTGTIKWSKDLRPAAREGRDHSVAVDEKNKRVYAIAANMVFAYDLNTGRKIWEAGGAEYCNLSGKAAPTAIVVEQTCFDTNKAIIHSLDLADGRNKSRWEYPVPGDSSAKANVISADPAVVAINPGSASARGNIVMFDKSGKPGGKVGMSQPFGKMPENTIFDSFSRYAFKDSTMVAAVTKGSTAMPTVVAAFDMKTGNLKWHQEVGTKQQPIQVVGFQGNSVLVAQSGGYTGQGRLMQLDLESGAQTHGGKFPAETTPSLDRDRMVVRGNLIVVVTQYASQYRPRVTAFGPTG